METKKERITRLAQLNDAAGVLQMLNTGLDPNFEGGWPLRLAARHGSFDVVKTLLQWGANPHLLSKAEASTLQLAVYSGLHWEEGSWELLLSYCDSSQLADGAAVAVVFRRLAALRQILGTGRCNTNVPTTLTGRTLESLAKGYNLEYILKDVPLPVRKVTQCLQCLSPALGRSPSVPPREGAGSSQSRALSPSVVQFFEQMAHQPSLSPHAYAHRSAAASAARAALLPASPLLFTSPSYSSQP